MSERSARPRRVRTAVLSIVTVVALGAGGVAVYAGLQHAAKDTCTVSAKSASYTLEPDQATNATTITAVGKRMHLPDHAITIGLAAALQESNLHNLAHGDRDSLGLFQQRPSQGWGTADQVMDPSYAAQAFFTHLARVNGWESLPVTTAAQQVQRSGAPEAYAQWETEARALAIATTGESPAAFTCRASAPKPGSVDSGFETTMTAELGPFDFAAAVPVARGWTVATWLVAHSHRFGISAVAFDGRRWTPSSGKWAPHSPTERRVVVERNT